MAITLPSQGMEFAGGYRLRSLLAFFERSTRQAPASLGAPDSPSASPHEIRVPGSLWGPAAREQPPSRAPAAASGLGLGPRGMSRCAGAESRRSKVLCSAPPLPRRRRRSPVSRPALACPSLCSNEGGSLLDTLEADLAAPRATAAAPPARGRAATMASTGRGVVDQTYKVPSCVPGMALFVPHDSNMRLGYQDAVLHKWTLTRQAHHLPAPLQSLCCAPTAAALPRLPAAAFCSR